MAYKRRTLGRRPMRMLKGRFKRFTKVFRKGRRRIVKRFKTSKARTRAIRAMKRYGWR